MKTSAVRQVVGMTDEFDFKRYAASGAYHEQGQVEEDNYCES